jgi:hypothetical protein
MPANMPSSVSTAKLANMVFACFVVLNVVLFSLALDSTLVIFTAVGRYVGNFYIALHHINFLTPL